MERENPWLHSIDAATTTKCGRAGEKQLDAYNRNCEIARELRFDQKATQLQVENGRTDGWMDGG